MCVYCVVFLSPSFSLSPRIIVIVYFIKSNFDVYVISRGLCNAAIHYEDNATLNSSEKQVGNNHE